MNATLDVYAHIFSSILHRQHPDNIPALLDQLPERSRPQAESALRELQQNMENLKKHLSHPHCANHNYVDVLSELNKIKVMISFLDSRF